MEKCTYCDRFIEWHHERCNRPYREPYFNANGFLVMDLRPMYAQQSMKDLRRKLNLKRQVKK